MRPPTHTHPSGSRHIGVPSALSGHVVWTMTDVLLDDGPAGETRNHPGLVADLHGEATATWSGLETKRIGESSRHIIAQSR